MAIPELGAGGDIRGRPVQGDAEVVRLQVGPTAVGSAPTVPAGQTLSWVLAGPHFRVSFASDAATNFGGEASVGRPLGELLPELAAAAVLDLLQLVRSGGLRHELSRIPLGLAREISAGAATTFYDLVAEPLRATEGQPARILLQAVPVAPAAGPIAAASTAEDVVRQHAARFHALTEQASDAILLLDPSGTVAYANASVSRVTGYQPDALVGQRLGAYLHPEDRGIVHEAIGRLTAQPGGVVYAEFRFRHAAGVWLTIGAQARNLLLDPDVRGIVISGRDITQDKEAATALQHLANIVASTHDAIIGYQLDGTVVSWNRGAERLYGYRAEEVLGRNAEFLDSSVELVEVLDRVTHGERIQNYETVRITKAGTRIHVALTVSPHVDDRGKITGFSAISRDITERKRAEADTREQNAYLNALHETTLAIISRLDLGELLDAIIARAASLLGAEHGFVDLVDDDRGSMFTRAALGLFREVPGVRVAPGDGLAGLVWQTGRPLLVADYRTIDRPIREVETVLGAVVGVPLKSGDRVVGVLGLAHPREGGVFRDDEIAVLQQFAELASIALDNARLYAAAQQELAERQRSAHALQVSEHRYRELFENARDVIYIHDLEGRFTAVNRAGLELTGYTREEILELNLRDLLPLHEVPSHEQRNKRRRAGEQVEDVVREILAKDGHRIPLEISSRLITV